MLATMCRVCLKRPEIPDERYGRCEACAKNQRIALKFRVGPGRDGRGIFLKAGELSPAALHSKWQKQLNDFSNAPQVKNHLGLHELELVVAKDRIESIRIAPNLGDKPDDVVAALRLAAERSDANWTS